MKTAPRSGPCTYGVELRRRGLFDAGWTEAAGLGCKAVMALFTEVAKLLYRDHSQREVGEALGVSYKMIANDLLAAGVAMRSLGTGNPRAGARGKAKKRRAEAGTLIAADATMDEGKRQALLAYQQGASLAEAGKIAGRSAGAVSRWISGGAKPQASKPVMLKDITAGLCLRQCPVTSGLPTKMGQKTFARLCHRQMFIDENRRGWCGVCRGKELPAELELL